MTTEQLKRAKEIETLVNHLSQQLSYWTVAPGFYQVDLRPEKGSYRNSIDDSMIDFEMVKLITIAKINLQLQTLNNEFLSL